MRLATTRSTRLLRDGPGRREAARAAAAVSPPPRPQCQRALPPGPALGAARREPPGARARRPLRRSRGGLAAAAARLPHSRPPLRDAVGEIDMVARRGDLVLFVEVKRRASVVDALTALLRSSRAPSSQTRQGLAVKSVTWRPAVSDDASQRYFWEAYGKQHMSVRTHGGMPRPVGPWPQTRTLKRSHLMVGANRHAAVLTCRSRTAGSRSGARPGR